MLENKRLGDLLTFQRGFDITKKEQKSGAVPIVSSSGVGSYHNVARVPGPGIVIGRKGTLGTVHYVREDFWPHDTTLWVREFKSAIPEYLRYFLPSLKLEAFDVGASNPTLNRNHLHKLKIKASTEEEQKKIAAILTAYDDLIENNRQRIALLEKMAEEIYREWFVRLRFPGHEHTPVIKGVPEWWEVRQLGKSFSTFLGGTPDRSVPGYWDGDVPWINSGEVNKTRIMQPSELITELGLYESATKLMPVGTVVLAITGATLGQVSRLEIQCCANQSVVGIYDSKGQYNEWLYFYLSLAIEGIIAFASGGAQQHINKGIVDAHKFLCPTKTLAAEFKNAVGPLLDQAVGLERQNVLLSKTRDLLLNRLISGKLRVDDLDIQFPPSMRQEAA